jgi:hypothetical protein
MGYPLMTLWPMWVLASLFAFAGRHEVAISLSWLPWWHRILGTVAALAFYGAHLGLLK